MDQSFFIVLNARWLLHDGSHQKRLAQGLCAIGRNIGNLAAECNLLLKFRRPDNEITIDEGARIKLIGSDFYVQSRDLCSFLESTRQPWVSLFFEGAADQARCIAQLWDENFFEIISTTDPTARLGAFGLPPTSATVVDSERPLTLLYRKVSSEDLELFSVHAARFIEAPHIITALFNHVFTIQAEDGICFPIMAKKLAEQLRRLMEKSKSVRIRAVRRSHLDLWSEVQGQRFSFLDSGVARIPAVAGIEPIGLRVGVYSVRPGLTEPEEREQWRMESFVIGDLVDRRRPTEERPETRRLNEAARYTLEPLTGLRHLKEFPDARLLLFRGPLVNQFVQYDEGEPNYVPFVSPSFLESFGIGEASILSAVRNIPQDSAGKPMWNQFMALYALILKQVDDSPTPIAGVVAHPTGRVVTLTVLDRLKEEGIVRNDYVARFRQELERYDITDDFLFGCVLKAGEYFAPVYIEKNLPNKARDRWSPVVREYRKPSATLLKTEETNFPLRVEMNQAASADVDFLARFLYHTSRLLPQYAFPVGLDTVDKYAKVPGWISRSVSAHLSAAVLRRALRTGDANVVTQTRLLLTKGHGDFFFRRSTQA